MAFARQRYLNTKLTPQEEANCAEFRKTQKEKGWDTFDETMDVRLQRYLSHARTKVQKAYESPPGVFRAFW